MQPTVTVVGEHTDIAIIPDYLLSHGPGVSSFVDPFLPTPAELQRLKTELSTYHRIGDTFSYTAPVIGGIAPTPAHVSFVLGAASAAITKILFIVQLPLVTVQRRVAVSS